MLEGKFLEVVLCEKEIIQKQKQFCNLDTVFAFRCIQCKHGWMHFITSKLENPYRIENLEVSKTKKLQAVQKISFAFT